VESTFERSRLDWDERERMPHAGVLRLYRDLLTMRKGLTGPAHAHALPGAVVVERRTVRLFVALRGDVSLPASGGVMVWHSEHPAYTERPRPPTAG
jgi:maltooligosyltrehalose trehalohydrolase